MGAPDQTADAAPPNLSADGADEATEPGASKVAPRTFTFACHPAERALILAGVAAGPAVALVMVYFLRSNAGAELGALSGPIDIRGLSRLTAGATVVLAVLLVVYGLLTLQVRSATRLTLTVDRFVYDRSPALPLGLLRRRADEPWTALTDLVIEHRWTWGGRVPLLVFRWPRGRLRVPIPDAWDEASAEQRPWFPRRPASTGGWRDHPMVRTAEELFRRAQG